MRASSLLLGTLLLGCGSTVVRLDADAGFTVDRPATTLDVVVADRPPVVTDAGAEVSTPPDVPLTAGKLDLLLVVDNSNSMRERQLQLARGLQWLLDSLTRPGDQPAVSDLHLAVVSTDLGTPSASVPSCVDSEVGDDGRFNPIRNGASLRAHEPWTTLPPGQRPARCANDPSQYPAFLSWQAATSDATAFADDIACNALLSVGGCGLEQPLEAIRRSLVVHGGSGGPNAGFVRDDAVLAVLLLTDEDDTSVRDCRYADPGTECDDATDVFRRESPRWPTGDLNLRAYLSPPGSRLDPSWPLDRYVDPARPDRGLTALKPGHPERVVFGALTGVPLAFDRDLDPMEWYALLGGQADGSDGYVGMSNEGLVSMRHANVDDACPGRVVPACRAEGTAFDLSNPCDALRQPFAWPARRVAEVARRFDEAHGNGVLGSICRADYRPFLGRFASVVRRRLPR